MSEINLFNRWKVKRSIFWGVVAGVPALCIIGFLALALVGPMMGATYSSRVDYLQAPLEGYGGGYDDEFSVGFDKAVAESGYPAPMPTNVYIDNASASASPAVPAERLIVREGIIQTIVEDTREVRDDIESIVYSLIGKGAYVVSSTENSRGEDRSPQISMVIRIPVEEFDSVMDQIAGMAVEVTYENEWSEDVTEEYVDLSSRIESMEAARDRLLTIMQEADTTEDLLQAEAQLTIRETEIDALKARRLYLSQSAKLSRITITLEPYILYEPIDTKWNPSETVRYAIEQLIEGFQNFVDFLIYFGIAALPWFILFGLIIWGIVALVRNRRAKKTGAKKE
jgi:hypothetical protein